MLKPNEEAASQQPASSGEKAAPVVDNSPEALITKTGRLSVGQRLAFMGSQMMTGIQVLWNKYKGWIIAALVTALLAAGIIAFFTGGAGLVVAVDIIAKAMILIFGAIAVYKAMGHIWDYVKFAWAGDTKKAGQSLAMAIAVIIVEFFIDKILLGMAKVFKRIVKAAKAAIKTTKTGRKFLAGATKVRRFAQTTIRKGVAKVKGSKLVVNMQNRIGKGAKKLNDLKQLILSKFKFKKFKIRRKGKWIQLLGKFNAWVLLANNKVVEDNTIDTKDLRFGDDVTSVHGPGKIMTPGDDLPTSLREIIEQNAADGKKNLDELFGLDAYKKVDSTTLDTKFPSDETVYITYVFKDGDEITYVGKASLKGGSPNQALNRRISRGHDHYQPGLTKEVIAVQTTKKANAGAEEFFKQSLSKSGAPLTNIDNALDMGRKSRRERSIRKINAFINSLIN